MTPLPGDLVLMRIRGDGWEGSIAFVITHAEGSYGSDVLHVMWARGDIISNLAGVYDQLLPRQWHWEALA